MKNFSKIIVILFVSACGVEHPKESITEAELLVPEGGCGDTCNIQSDCAGACNWCSHPWRQSGNCLSGVAVAPEVLQASLDSERLQEFLRTASATPAE